MATRLLTQYKQRLAGLELEPDSGGCFELSADDQLVYSKLASGDFPDEDEMVVAIGQLLD